LNNALATLKALASYKHADFFNKVIVDVATPDDDQEETLAEGEVKVEKGKVIAKVETSKDGEIEKSQ